jgi:hypothetical protein
MSGFWREIIIIPLLGAEIINTHYPLFHQTKGQEFATPSGIGASEI